MTSRQAATLEAYRQAQIAKAEARRQERLEDLAWMVETGETIEGAARRLGLSQNALEKWTAENAPGLLRKLRERDVLPREAYGRRAKARA